MVIIKNRELGEPSSRIRAQSYTPDKSAGDSDLHTASSAPAYAAMQQAAERIAILNGHRRTLGGIFAAPAGGSSGIHSAPPSDVSRIGGRGPSGHGGDWLPLSDVVAFLETVKTHRLRDIQDRFADMARSGFNPSVVYDVLINRFEVKTAQLEHEIGHQNANANRSITELTSNAVDAMNDSAGGVNLVVEDGSYVVEDFGKGMNAREVFERLFIPQLSGKDGVGTIGRFGIGFYTALAHLKDADSRVIVDTLGPDGQAIRVEFCKLNGELGVRVGPSSRTAQGTRVEVIDSRISRSTMLSELREHMGYVLNKRIVANGETANALDPARITAVGSGTAYVSPDAAMEGRAIITMGGVKIEEFRLSGFGVPRLMVFDMPLATKLPESRNQVRVDETVVRQVKAIIDHADAIRDPDERLRYLNGIAPMVRALQKRNECLASEHDLVAMARAKAERHLGGAPRMPHDRLYDVVAERGVIRVDELYLERQWQKRFATPAEWHGQDTVLLVDFNAAASRGIAHDKERGAILLDRKLFDAHRTDPAGMSVLTKLLGDARGAWRWWERAQEMTPAAGRTPSAEAQAAADSMRRVGTGLPEVSIPTVSPRVMKLFERHPILTNQRAELEELERTHPEALALLEELDDAKVHHVEIARTMQTRRSKRISNTFVSSHGARHFVVESRRGYHQILRSDGMIVLDDAVDIWLRGEGKDAILVVWHELWRMSLLDLELEPLFSGRFKPDFQVVGTGKNRLLIVQDESGSRLHRLLRMDGTEVFSEDAEKITVQGKGADAVIVVHRRNGTKAVRGLDGTILFEGKCEDIVVRGTRDDRVFLIKQLDANIAQSDELDEIRKSVHRAANRIGGSGFHIGGMGSGLGAVLDDRDIHLISAGAKEMILSATETAASRITQSADEALDKIMTSRAAWRAVNPYGSPALEGSYAALEAHGDGRDRLFVLSDHGPFNLDEDMRNDVLKSIVMATERIESVIHGSECMIQHMINDLLGRANELARKRHEMDPDEYNWQKQNIRKNIMMNMAKMGQETKETAHVAAEKVHDAIQNLLSISSEQRPFTRIVNRDGSSVFDAALKEAKVHGDGAERVYVIQDWHERWHVILADGTIVLSGEFDNVEISGEGADRFIAVKEAAHASGTWIDRSDSWRVHRLDGRALDTYQMHEGGLIFDEGADTLIAPGPDKSISWLMTGDGNLLVDTAWGMKTIGKGRDRILIYSQRPDERSVVSSLDVAQLRSDHVQRNMGHLIAMKLDREMQGRALGVISYRPEAFDFALSLIPHVQGDIAASEEVLARLMALREAMPPRALGAMFDLIKIFGRTQESQMAVADKVMALAGMQNPAIFLELRDTFSGMEDLQEIIADKRWNGLVGLKPKHRAYAFYLAMDRAELLGEGETAVPRIASGPRFGLADLNTAVRSKRGAWKQFDRDAGAARLLIEEQTQGSDPELSRNRIRHAMYHLGDGRNLLFLRELIQNALDAIRREKTVSPPPLTLPPQGGGKISIESFEEDGRHVLRVADPVGMSLSEVINNLLIVGESTKGEEDLGKFGVGFFTIYPEAQELRIATGKGDGKKTLVTLTPVYRDDVVIDVNVSYEVRPSNFKGTVIERIAKGEIPALDAAMAKSSVLTYGRFIDPREIAINYNGKLVNEEMAPIAARPFNGLGTLTMYQASENAYTVGGLYVKDIPADYLKDLPEPLTKLWLEKGIVVDLPPSTALVRSRNDFVDAARMDQKLKSSIPALLVGIYLERFAAGEIDIASLPHVYFDSMYGFAERRSISAAVHRDAARLMQGDEIDFGLYRDDRAFTQLITLLPSMEVDGGRVSLFELLRMVEAEEKIDTAKLPIAVRSRIEQRLRTIAAQKAMQEMVRQRIEEEAAAARQGPVYRDIVRTAAAEPCVQPNALAAELVERLLAREWSRADARHEGALAYDAVLGIAEWLMERMGYEHFRVTLSTNPRMGGTLAYTWRAREPNINFAILGMERITHILADILSQEIFPRQAMNGVMEEIIDVVTHEQTHFEFEQPTEWTHDPEFYRRQQTMVTKLMSEGALELEDLWKKLKTEYPRPTMMPAQDYLRTFVERVTRGEDANGSGNRSTPANPAMPPAGMAPMGTMGPAMGAHACMAPSAMDGSISLMTSGVSAIAMMNTGNVRVIA